MNSKKRKSYFMHGNYHKRKKIYLQSGMKGFFCTCNGKEKECIREALNLLDEHLAKICPKNEDEVGKTDIEEDLNKEIEELKNQNSHTQTFQVVETDVKSCVFIKFMMDNAIELVSSIFEEIIAEKKRMSKFLLRLVPIEVTCKAYIDNIKKAADEIFDAHFKCEATTYAVIYNHRYNNSVVRTEIIESLCILVRDRNLAHSVDIKNPKKAIIVEIVKGICCLSVVPNFLKYKKYNLVNLASCEGSQDSVIPKSNKDDILKCESDQDNANSQVINLKENNESENDVKREKELCSNED